MTNGTAYGLGVGPGDPELITLKALRVLRAAPVVAYPAPESGDSFARRIMAEHLPGGQVEIVIRIPMQGPRTPMRGIYDAAAAKIGAHLGAGRDVAVLCQGDPFFYGSFMYLFGRLGEAYRVEVVPGVSSLTACAAAAGAPLAARNDILKVLPAPLDDDVLEARLTTGDAWAIVKLGRHFARIRRLLDRLGLADRARYVEHATLDDQRVLPLADLDPADVPYFSMILIHRRGEAWR